MMLLLGARITVEGNLGDSTRIVCIAADVNLFCAFIAIRAGGVDTPETHVRI
jgi:hypothetical protein